MMKKPMKPKAMAKQGYADGGEIQSDSEEMPGIRLGQNANIGDDTRARAMAHIERVNKGKDPGLDSAPASRPAPRRTPQKAPSAAPKAAPKESTASRSEDGPVAMRASDPDNDRTESGVSSRVGDFNPMAGKAARQQAMRDAAPEGTGERIRDRLAGAIGLASMGITRGRPLNTIAPRVERALPGPAARKALPAPSRGAVEGPADLPKLPAPKGRSKSAPRDGDDARYADEGNPNYAKGGMIGCRDYGKKR